MIVAGFGFRAGASIESLRDALARAGSTEPPGLLATAENKADAGAFQAFARMVALPVRPVEGRDMERQTTLTRSAASHTARSTGSVAEASALAAAGPGARLLGPRVISGDRMATCALAQGEDT